MLFGIDYARRTLHKLREREAQAYQNGYKDADEKVANYRKGYDDGFNAALNAAFAGQTRPVTAEDYETDASA